MAQVTLAKAAAIDALRELVTATQTSVAQQLTANATQQTPSFLSRAAAVTGAQALPPQINMIISTEGNAVVVRTRGSSALDPLYGDETTSRWGISKIIDPVELRLGRVWQTATTDLTGQTPPEGVDQISVAHSGGHTVWRRLGLPPGTPNPALHAQTADGRWWALSEDSAAIKASITALSAEGRNGRIWFCPITTANGPSGQTPPTGTTRIVTNAGNNSHQWWRSIPAPTPATETATVKLDAAGTWWTMLFDSRTLADTATALSATLATLAPVQMSVVAASSAGERNASLWTTPTVFRTITAAEIIGAGSLPPGLTNPVTGTAETVAAPGGVRLIWRDQSGRVFNRLYVAGAWGDYTEVPSVATRTADTAARVSGDTALAARLDALPPVSQTVRRGASAVAVEINGVPVLAFNSAGEARLFLDQWTLDDLAARLEITGGGGGSASPVSPDILGNLDGWNAWVEDDLVTFTAALEGAAPREYIMKPGESAWVNGRSVVPVRLLYGDQMGAAGVSVAQPVNVYRIATLNDGAGQAGLAGVAATAPAVGIQRAGGGFAAIVADLWVAAQSVARWALVRAENVAGASLASLTTGQPMTNLVRALTEAERLLPGYRREASAESVTIMHGAGDDSATYAADLIALMQQINTRVGPRRINLYQPSGTTQRADFASAEGTLEAFRQKGALPATLVSATYWCGIAAGTVGTLDPVSMTMLAELEARAAADDNWIVPLAFNASRSGAVIDIDFEVMPAVALVAPTTGLFVDGHTIQSAVIVADPLTGRMTRLRVTLTTAPSVPVTVRYCRGPGARFTGNLRDNWSAPSITGGTLYRYACSFQFTV